MDKKTQIVNLTNILLDIPNEKETISFFILSFLTFSFIILNYSIKFYILYLLCILLPNLITLLFINEKLTFKRTLFINLFCFVVFSSGYLIFLFINNYFLFNYIIYFNGIMILSRLLILNITLDLKKRNLFFNSIFYSLTSLVFFNLYIYYFYHNLIFIFLIKSIFIIVSFTILTYIIIYIIGLPIHQVYNIKSQDIVRGIIDHWYDKGYFLEKILSKISQKTILPIHIYGFKKNDKIRAIFIIPYFHIGPFGLIGGGKIYQFLCKNLKKKYDCPIFIFHGTTTHDFNPVNSNKKEEILKKIEEIIDNSNYEKIKGNIYYTTFKEANLMGLDINNKLFFSVSFSPKPTDDVDLGLGLSIMNKFEKHFKSATYVDPHNCFKKGNNELNQGDVRYYELEELVDQFNKKNKENLSIGFSNIQDQKLIDLEYIGNNGICSFVGKTENKKFAFILIDGNNMMPNLREKYIELIKKLGYDYVEILTSDNHSINTIRGVINPVKESKILEDFIIESIKKAEENMESNLEFCFSKFLVELDTFGAKRENEIISIIETTIGIIKYLAIPFLILSLILIFLIIFYM